MKYKIVRLDKRYSQKEYFQFMIEFSHAQWKGTGVLEFDRARKWFNTTFGWSQDVDTRSAMILSGSVNPTLFSMEDINPLWAYGVKYNDYRIYVATDKELNWFILSHPASH